MLPSTENRDASWFRFEHSSTHDLSLAGTVKLFCIIKFATQILMTLVPEHLITINPTLGKVPRCNQGKLKPLQHSGTFCL